MLRRLIVLFATFGAVVAACGGPTSLDIGRYDRSCTTSSDCVAVTTDACCGCPSVAINNSDLSRYEADLQAAAKNCGACVEKPCAPLLAVCAGGLCTTGYAPDAGPADAGNEGGSDASGDAIATDASDAGSDAATDAAGDAQDAAID
ncbi:MAG TPA: hypothetical protein VLM85_03640 [Polyangiaceae bacterium]|nr:hypothetical protein [Polyangiaceae bacterium]